MGAARCRRSQRRSHPRTSGSRPAGPGRPTRGAFPPSAIVRCRQRPLDQSLKAELCGIHPALSEWNDLDHLAMLGAEYRDQNKAGVVADHRSDLLVATCETGRLTSFKSPQVNGRKPCSSAQGGAGASWIRANADRPFGREAATTQPALSPFLSRGCGQADGPAPARGGLLLSWIGVHRPDARLRRMRPVAPLGAIRHHRWHFHSPPWSSPAVEAPRVRLR